MYQLKDYNKNYKYVILDKSIKNLFIASILLGINNNTFNNDNKKLNKSIKEYNIKLNNLIKEKLNNNENFKKFKKSHLKILEELIKLNIIIYDNIDNKIIYKNNKYNKNIVLLKEKSNYLLLLKHENNKKSINESLPIIRNNKQETKEENNQKNKKTKEVKEEIEEEIKEEIKKEVEEEVEEEIEEQKGGGDDEKIIEGLIDDCLINKLSEYYSNQIYEKVDEYIKDILNDSLNDSLSIQQNLNKINNDKINEITNLILNDKNYKFLKNDKINDNVIDNLIFNISMNLIIKSYDNSDNFITDNLNNFINDDLDESVNDTKTNTQNKPPSSQSKFISSISERQKLGNPPTGGGQKGGASNYNSFKKEFEKTKNNNLFKIAISNYPIKKLLETGIDNFHDFGKLIHITGNEVNKGDIFDTFSPQKFNNIWLYHSKDMKFFTTYLLELFFETFNNKIVEKISNNYPTLNNASNIVIPFKPRISQKKNITTNYQPFSEGWEKNATNYYIYGNTQKRQRTQNFFRNSKDKTIIIFQDSQGATESVLSHIGNVLMRPGSFYSSLDNVKEITKNQIIQYLRSLQSNEIPLDEESININYKVLMYNQLKKQILERVGTEILATTEKSWHMETPASAVDGAGKNYLNFDNFQANIEKINEICNLTNDNDNELRLEEIRISQDNFIIKNNTDSDYNLYSLIIKTNDGKIIDILNETYKEHFNNITDSTFRTDSDNLNKSGFYNMSKNSSRNNDGNTKMSDEIKYGYDIKFQIVLNKKTVDDEDRLYPVLLMFHSHLFQEQTNLEDTTIDKIFQSKIIHIKKRVERINQFYGTLEFYNYKNKNILNIIDLENLNDLRKLSSLINQYYKNLRNNSKNETTYFDFINNYNVNNIILKKFKNIYNILECWTLLNSNINIKNELQYWDYNHINIIFLRILYTLKMIGDHGQVNYIKALKDYVPGFKDKVSVLFTTGDSLSRLYACVNGITNVSTVTSDFPSEDYCNSTPKGMVYYDTITETTTLFDSLISYIGVKRLRT
jgi:hypothetical protein